VGAVGASPNQKLRRRARWSRNPEDLRVARVEELEKALTESGTLDEVDDEADADDGWRARAESVAEDEPRDMSGFLMKKTGAMSGQKRRYFVLSGGTLLWYKSEKDRSPTGFVHLSECFSITEHSAGMIGASSRIPDAESGCVFVVKAAKEYILWADDESERDKWVRALRHNRMFPPLAVLAGAQSARLQSSRSNPSSMRQDDDAMPDRRASTESDTRAVLSEPPEVKKAAKRSMLGNLALRAEKKMASRAVTSDLGKKLLREYCLPETFVLLQALRDLASVDPTMPPKAGAKIEDTILRMAVKVVLIHQHGRLAGADFNPMINLVDDICVDVVRKFDATREPPFADEEDPMHRRMGEQMRLLNAGVGRMLEGHVSAKNIGALGEVIQYLGSPENMRRFVNDSQCQAPLSKIVSGLRNIYGL
jgi:hypothetical protein